MTYAYNAQGCKTAIGWPDTFFTVTPCDSAGRPLFLQAKDGLDDLGVQVTFAYDLLSRRTGLSFLNGASASYAFTGDATPTVLTDDDNTLEVLDHSFISGSDYGADFGYNAVNQMTSRTITPSATYDWQPEFNEDVAYVANELNQYTNVTDSAFAAPQVVSPAYDPRFRGDRPQRQSRLLR